MVPIRSDALSWWGDEERVVPAIGVELLLYVIVLGYALLMAVRIPSGDAGLFPRITLLPLIGAVMIKLLSIALELADVDFGGRLRDIGLSRPFQSQSPATSFSDQTKNPTFKYKLTMIGMVTGGIGLVYMFGLLVGGGIFMLVFIHRFHRDTRFGVLITLGIILLLYALSTTLGLRMWGGLVELGLP